MQPQTQTPNNLTFQPPANLSQIKGLMNFMQSGGDPTVMRQSMLQNNPNGNSIIAAIAKHGGNAEAAFYDMAKQKGVDPNLVLGMLK